MSNLAETFENTRNRTKIMKIVVSMTMLGHRSQLCTCGAAILDHQVNTLASIHQQVAKIQISAKRTFSHKDVGCIKLWPHMLV